MRATAVEHETEENIQARRPQPKSEEAALASANLAEPPRAVLDPGLLLGLQARAGNAAVAALIDGQRKSAVLSAETTREPGTTAEAPQPVIPSEPSPSISSVDAADSSPSVSAGERADSSMPVAGRTGEEVQPEATIGSGEEDLAPLAAAADESAVGEPNGAQMREAATRDAQVELAELAAPGPEPSDSGAGGEGGVPIDARPPPKTPDITTADAAVALSQVSALPPGQLISSLGSVSGAADRQAAHEQVQLATDPPARPRHPGAPSIAVTPAQERIAILDRPVGGIPKSHEGQEVPVPHPHSLPVLPEAVPANGQIPTHDPGLELHVGPAPHLPLAGNADPVGVDQQRSHVLEGMRREHEAAGHDAAQPLGEDQIFPAVPAETLRAVVPLQAPANGHGPAASYDEKDEAASIVAQQEKGGEIQGALASGLSSLADERHAYTERAGQERSKAEVEMAKLEQANVQEQAGERATAKSDVSGLRSQWSAAQQDLVTAGQREADAKTTETLTAVAEERQAAERQAAAHYQEGQQEADQARRHAEQQAAAERQKSPGGLLGAVGAAAQSLFDKAKQAVQGVFDRARQLVRGAIERAQQLATAVLEKARQTIVGVLRTAGSALTAIGDRVLSAFPTLRDRFRGLIQARIAAAEAAVNKLANALKQSVQAVLNGLGAALSAAISLMQLGMHAVIDGVRASVQGALDFARGAVAAFGTFARLIKDVAANPGQWISNLALAARDGIRNHLWPELKSAVQGWFNDKVDSLLGLGAAAWNLLRRGGITVAQVATVAWEGIKSMIPQTVIWILIEKLVALIVPAAAAVMLIIQALQAAWASLSRIVQAFDAFMAFLKGVRWGNAGALFGKALSAGAVAVIEFISQFLLQRLVGAVGAVASKIRALAKSIGVRLTTGITTAVRTGKRVANWLGATGSKTARSFVSTGSGLVSAGKRFTRGLTNRAELVSSPRSIRVKPGHEFATAHDFTIIEEDGTKAVRYGPINPGPLHSRSETIVNSFRSGSYTGRTLARPKDLYRVYTDDDFKFGAYWTDIAPSGPLQAKVDLALRPSFGNKANKMVHIRVPAGETVFEGIAGPQSEDPGVNLLGGGRQTVLNNVDASWEVK